MGLESVVITCMVRNLRVWQGQLITCVRGSSYYVVLLIPTLEAARLINICFQNQGYPAGLPMEVPSNKS